MKDGYSAAWRMTSARFRRASIAFGRKDTTTASCCSAARKPCIAATLEPLSIKWGNKKLHRKSYAPVALVAQPSSVRRERIAVVYSCVAAVGEVGSAL